jgi:hypothetical protein
MNYTEEEKNYFQGLASVDCNLRFKAFFPGDIHHRIHVLGVFETVSEADQEKQQDLPTQSMEEMVYPDFVRPQVWQILLVSCFDLKLNQLLGHEK